MRVLIRKVDENWLCFDLKLAASVCNATFALFLMNSREV